MKTLKLLALTAFCIAIYYGAAYGILEAAKKMVRDGNWVLAGIAALVVGGILAYGLKLYAQIVESIRTARPV